MSERRKCKTCENFARPEDIYCSIGCAVTDKDLGLKEFEEYAMSRKLEPETIDNSYQRACEEARAKAEVESICMTDLGVMSEGAIDSDNNGGSTDYYKLPKGATDLQDLIEDKEMSFAIGNIFKACYRLNNDHHSDKLRELNKIKWFIDRLIKKETS